MNYDLFHNTKDLNRFIPKHISLTPDDLQPYSRDIIDDYILPLIGENQWDAMMTAKCDGDSEGVNVDLFAYVAPIVARLAVKDYVSNNDIKLSAGGATVTVTDTQKPASQYRVEQFKRGNWDKGYKSLDRLIAFLIKRETDLTHFVSDQLHLKLRCRIINTTEQFASHVPMMQNRWLFVRCIPIIDRIADGWLRCGMTDSVYAEMLAQIKAKTTPYKYASVESYVQAALAHKAWSEALIELGITLDDRGATLYVTSFTGTMDRQQPPDEKRLLRQIEHHADLADIAMANLKSTMAADPDTFDLYTNNTATDPDTGVCPSNEDDDKIVAF